MAEIIVPRLPEGAKKGLVIQWHAHEGDFIDEGDDLVDIEAAREQITIVAPVTGVISDVFFEESEEVEFGEVIAEIEEE